MDLPVERWYRAIEKRYSRRQYDGRPIDPEKVASLEETIRLFTPFEDTRAVLVTQPPTDVFRGAVGSYGKVKNAPAYLAFIGQEDSPTVQEHIGYFGEGLILEATALGLCTCWVGGFFRPKEVARQITLARGERVFAITPIGYPSAGETLEERLMSHRLKRKPLQAIIVGNVGNKEGLPAWLITALEAARLAPSAVNRQPWVFRVEDDAVTLAMDNPKDTFHMPKRLDCGIAMLHFELGAAHAGVKGYWEYLATPQVARFRVKRGE